MHQKPPKYGIRRIVCIHNPAQTQTFEGALKSIEYEAKNSFYSPKWSEEDLKEERVKVITRWKKQAEQFSPLEVPAACEAVIHFPMPRSCLFGMEVTPSRNVNRFARPVLLFFGKHNFSVGSKGNSTDSGFYGSGIYFTNSAHYASMYSKQDGYLLLSWVSMREPYPVVSDIPHSEYDKNKFGKDMTKLMERGDHYENYNTHYIPVASIKEPEI